MNLRKIRTTTTEEIKSYPASYMDMLCQALKDVHGEDALICHLNLQLTKLKKEDEK